MAMTLGLHNIHFWAQSDLAGRLSVGGERDGAAVGRCVQPSLSHGPRSVARVCRLAACGRPFTARASDVAKGRGLFCSRRCASVVKGQTTNARHSQTGAGNHNFKGWRSRDKRAYVDRFRAKYPEKAAAHDAVRDALSAGRLIRPVGCQCCGRPVRLQAHHDDYAQPLVVTFACGPCHRLLDAERRAAQSASRATTGGPERVSA